MQKKSNFSWHNGHFSLLFVQKLFKFKITISAGTDLIRYTKVSFSTIMVGFASSDTDKIAAIGSYPAHCFRSPFEHQKGSAPKDLVENSEDEKASDKGDYILCRQCRHIITNKDERIEIDGTHQHTFANPHGIVFEIGCFRSATGCGYTGPATDDFSWFKGFSWRIAVCGSCITHLGWLFISFGSEHFDGLILDRLVYSNPGG